MKNSALEVFFFSSGTEFYTHYQKMTCAAIQFQRYRTYKVEILLRGKSGKEIIPGACEAGKSDMLKMFHAFEGCLYMHESKSAKKEAGVKVTSGNY